MTAYLPTQEPVVQVREVSTLYGERLIHDRISLEVDRGEILAIVGGSGSGKSTLLREMVMLQSPSSGSIRVLGYDIMGLSAAQIMRLRCRIGVLFQDGALFGGLTVRENVALVLKEHTRLSEKLIAEIAAVKIGLTGLAPEVGALYPSQLSGGMRKRAALARALALDPELLFLDEPTSGLDPGSADALDDLVLKLKGSLGLTMIMVSHDLDSLWRVADRVVVLGEGRVLGIGTMKELCRFDDPLIRVFFEGPRGRAARSQA